MAEASDQIVDKAERVIIDGLEDPEERYSMAKFVVQRKGKDRGWGNGTGNSVNLNTNGGNIVIQWADGSHVSGTPTEGNAAKDITGSVIESDPVEASNE